MALDWTHLKKTRRIKRESSTRLESTGSTKTWETKVDMEKICRRGNRRKGKDWREMKRLANDRTKWRNFTSALCSERRQDRTGLEHYGSMLQAGRSRVRLQMRLLFFN
jgi:hypothetical protein